jgi:hypothetical protein
LKAKTEVWGGGSGRPNPAAGNRGSREASFRRPPILSPKHAWNRSPWRRRSPARSARPGSEGTSSRSFGGTCASSTRRGRARARARVRARKHFNAPIPPRTHARTQYAGAHARAHAPTRARSHARSHAWRGCAGAKQAASLAWEGSETLRVWEGARCRLFAHSRPPAHPPWVGWWAGVSGRAGVGWPLVGGGGRVGVGGWGGRVGRWAGGGPARRSGCTAKGEDWSMGAVYPMWDWMLGRAVPGLARLDDYAGLAGLRVEPGPLPGPATRQVKSSGA